MSETAASTLQAAAVGALPRLLSTGPYDATVPLDLSRHHHVHGPLPYRGAARGLIEDIRGAGLTGRGGAAFPTAVKMSAVAGAGRRGRLRPVVVANGAEGEPASAKDKHLLWSSPHLVLDGLQLAVEAVGARFAYLCVHRGGGLAARLGGALGERGAARLDRIAPQLAAAPPRFLAGEESALASWLGGDLALPRFKPPRVFERGVKGAPTLVLNVETLAHVALIARHGPAWFRQLGTAAEPGSMLVTCRHSDGRAEVREVEIGSSVAAVLGMARPRAQAVLVGGYHGTWIPVAQAAGLWLTGAAMREAGAALGAGVLAALPAGRCGLAETARVARYLAAESAGQCGPCRNGLPAVAHALTQLAGMKPHPQWLPHLRRWTGLVTGRGACHHPDGTARFVRSALAVFDAEIAAHRRGHCCAQAPAAGAPPHAPFLPVPAHVPADWRDWR